MKKMQKITKAAFVRKWFLFLAITVGLVTSCKDYDDDIDNLQSQIDKLSASLSDITSEISDGKVVTSVTSTTSGLTITFSDGNSYTITNGTDGTDGTSSVVTIGSNGNWYINGEDTGTIAVGTDGTDGTDGTNGSTPYIGENGNWWIGETDTEVCATGTNGTDGLTPYIGENGDWWIGDTDTKTKATGDVVTIVDGYWYINGISTGVLANAGSIMAVLNEAGTYYTIAITDQDGTVTSIAIPVASQYVSSIAFVPTYASAEGVSYIYAPILMDNTTLISNPTVTLAYQVNPASVQESNFSIEGLSKQTATVMTRSSSSFLAVNKVSYQGGTLKVSYTGDLENSDDSKLDYYALVLKNNSVDDNNDSEYVYSNYVFADFEDINIDDVTISKTANESYAAIGVTTGDWSVGYKNTDGINLNATSYYTHGSTKVELSDFFACNYSYALVSTSSWTNNAYFELDGNNIKVKDNQAAAVGKIAKIAVTLKVNSTTVQTGTIYVEALDRIPTETTVLEKTIGTYYRGNTINLAADGFSEDLLINAIDNAGLSHTSVAVSDDCPTGISFNGGSISSGSSGALVAGTTVTVKILPSVAAGTYSATRTYTTVDGSKWYIKYTITVADGYVDWDASKVSSYWNTGLTSMYVYGKESGGDWSLEGDLNDGFDVSTLIPSPAPSTGSSLSINSHFYTINGSYTGVQISGSTIKLTSNYSTYVEGTPIPVTLTVIYENDASSQVSTYTHTFYVQFKNPIKIEYSNTIDILNQDYGNFTYYTRNGWSWSSHSVSDYVGQSPWDGITVKNLATSETLTDYTNISTLIDISSMTETPSISDTNLGIDWNRYVTGISPTYTMGYIIWDYTGTVLTSALNVTYNITYTTSWGQSFTTTDSPLKITVTQP